MKIHKLKTWPEPYQAIADLRKRFEYRERRDRDFRVGDHLRLYEWDPATAAYTGRWQEARVMYLIDGPAFGIPDGFTVMSLDSPLAYRYNDSGR